MNEEVEFDEVDLILKTTQFPTWKVRLFDKDALYYWMCAKDQQEETLRKLELFRKKSRN